MNHCVPDFDIDDDYAIPTASAAGTHVGALTSTRTKKIAIGDEEDIMELLWQNGQVVLLSQNQRSSLFKKPPSGGAEEAEIPQSTRTTREIRSFENVVNRPQPQLFIQEDEMASWLHFPITIDDSSFAAYSNDLLYSAPPSPPRETRSIVTEILPLTPLPHRPPPVPPAAPPRRPPEAAAPKLQNFMHFSRLPKAAAAAISHGCSAPARELTVVDSNDTPAVQTESRVSPAADGELFSGCHVGCGTTSANSTQALGTSTAAGDLATACELIVTSSPSGSGGSASASGGAPRMVYNPRTSPAEDRKRKGRETDDTDSQSEDVEFESADTKKQARGSTSAKRSRAAEVHNLSERRRRDRINERMRALQELIPRCNKSDKASMLDEAIEYLKSLQLQVQMMSMGCGMLPLMYPGVQQYMPAMGMEMGMNRPIMPYPPLMPASGISNPAVAANMGPRFPVPAFHMQPVPVPDSSRIQASNQLDPVLNSLVTNNPNQPQMPNFADPYQQFIALHQAQIPLPQNQVVVPPSKPSRSRGVGIPDKRQ